MKKIENIFKIIFNYKELENENKRLKKRINRLEKLISISQTEKQTYNSSLSKQLNAITASIEQQSEKLESITEKINKLNPSTTNTHSKKNIIATILAIVSILGIMMFNIAGISKMDEWIKNENIFLLVCKATEVLISSQLILHTGYLSKHEQNIY